MTLKDSFFFSKPFLKNAIMALGIGIVGLMLIFGWLGFYTNHGEAYSVPNFEGLDIRQAREIAKEKDLRLEVIDSVYNAPGRRGSVIDQTPPKDFKVKSGRTIFITIKSLQPEATKLPKLKQLTLVQAKADIQTFGLKIGRISYRPSKYDNLVLEVRYKGELINQGDLIFKGDAVDLVLGEKEGMGNATCPDLLGMSENDAIFKAAEEMLNIGSVIYDNSVISYSDTLKARVIRQSPSKHVSLSPGDEIDIWLSLKADTTTYIDPEF